MKRIALLTLLTIVPIMLMSSTGIGIIIGEPTGISAKFWTSDNNAFDAALAYSFSDKDHLYLHINYLHHNVSQLDNVGIPWYWGIGGNVRYNEKANDEVKLAARVPIGLNYMLESMPSEAFIEVSPALDVVPKVGFSMGAAIGFRFYF